MNFSEYQNQALETDSFGKQDPKNIRLTDPAYVAKILGLVGEAGEVAEKYKKLIRDGLDQPDSEAKQELLKELGDVLWYIAVLTNYLGDDLETVAQINLDKLSDRRSRGVIKGKGDNR